MSGYTNTGGSLNVTCSSTGSWSPFPNCVLNNPNVSPTTTTTMSTNTGAACTIDSTTLSITNGYYSNVSLSYASSNSATGWIQFACMPGYALDPGIGSLYTCNNGVWSTKPRCIMSSGCSISTVQSVLSTASGLQLTSQYKLTAGQSGTGSVLSGSYIVFTCMSGYTNTGGSLNVTCSSTGSWSPFPNCVLNNPNVSPITTTTMSTNTGAACIIDSTTLSITNGYYSNISLSYTSGNSATGWIQFACIPGYALDPAIGNLYACNNGVWSTKPRCIITGRCSFTALQTFISNSPGLQVTGQSQLMQTQGDSSTVLNGSYIVFACMSGYTNTGGSLNVTCSASGSWSPFPNCISNVPTTTMSSSNGSPCPYDASLLSIANGYASTWNGVMSPTANQALSGAFITYVCTSPYTIAGSSSMTCTNGVWSVKPICTVSNAGSVTTVPPGSTCGDIPTVANTYVAMATSVQFVNNTYGRKVQYACNVGYTYVNTSGQLSVSCVNGVWDPLPVCSLRPACSVSQLQSALVNMQFVSSSLNAGNGGILAGGWLQVRCASGFSLSPSSGSLNITCLSTGTWTPFPVCSR